MGTEYNDRQVFSTALTDIKSTDVEGVGTIRCVGTAKYMWVRNGEASTALTVGQACCWETGATGDYDVIIPATGYLHRYAGRVMSTSLTAACYGWIQVEGIRASSLCYGTATNDPIAAGTNLKPVNTKTYMLHDTLKDAAPTYANAYETVEVGFTTAPTTGANCTVSIFGQKRG